MLLLHHFILYPLYQPFLNTLANSGHIPQNARLAIRALDVAMPYVCFQKTVISNQLSTSKSIPEARFDFKWHVGGAITVDATWLVVHNPPSSFPSANDSSIEMSNWSLYLDRIGDPHDPRSLPPKPDTAQQSSSSSSTSTSSSDAEQGPTTAAKLPLSVSSASSGYGRHVGEHLSPRYFEANFKVSLAQSSDSSAHARSVPSSDTTLHTQSISSSTSTTSDAALTPNMEEKKRTKSHSTLFSNKGQTIYLSPGMYWVVAWSEVDSSWGKEKQGEGADTPQSYLSNARTNTQWLSSQSKQKNVPSNLRNAEVKSGVRKEYDAVRSREVRGRKVWPSDPMIIEVMKDGRVLLRSSVLECAWWKRGMSELKWLRSSIHPPTAPPSPSESESESETEEAGAEKEAVGDSTVEGSGADNEGSKSTGEGTRAPAEPVESNNSNEESGEAKAGAGVENDDNMSGFYGMNADTFSFESGRGYILLFGLFTLLATFCAVRKLMSMYATQSRARRIPAQFQRIPIAQS